MPDGHNTLYELVSADGSAIGNQSRKERFPSTVKGAREAAFEQSRHKTTPSHRATHG